MNSVYEDQYFHTGIRAQEEAITRHQNALVYDVIGALKPQFGIDGDQYFFLYGVNLQEGIAGFGATANEAAYDFMKNWQSMKVANSTPIAITQKQHEG